MEQCDVICNMSTINAGIFEGLKLPAIECTQCDTQYEWVADHTKDGEWLKYLDVSKWWPLTTRTNKSSALVLIDVQVAELFHVTRSRNSGVSASMFANSLMDISKRRHPVRIDNDECVVYSPLLFNLFTECCRENQSGSI